MMTMHSGPQWKEVVDAPQAPGEVGPSERAAALPMGLTCSARHPEPAGASATRRIPLRVSYCSPRVSVDVWRGSTFRCLHTAGAPITLRAHRLRDRMDNMYSGFAKRLTVAKNARDPSICPSLIHSAQTISDVSCDGLSISVAGLADEREDPVGPARCRHPDGRKRGHTQPQLLC